MKAVEKAYQLAKAVRENAYAPYSKYKVGVSVKVVGQDQFFNACNVENSSYGGCICAERNAINQCVAVNKEVNLEFLVLVTDNKEGALPCGICLQTISEFCPPDFPIHIANLEGVLKSFCLRDLLPHSFDSSKLPS